MRFLHTADLHIGKRVNQVNMIVELQLILRQIAEIAKTEGCDAVLIAGDVYDQTSPTAEAMATLDAFFNQMRRENIPLYLIAGNHDSGKRLSYFSEMARECGVTLCGEFSGTMESFCWEDEFGPVRMFCLPYLQPALVRRFYPQAKITSYDDAVRIVLEHTPMPLMGRNLLLCHQFVTGAQRCDSEEMSIGGAENISADLFDAFDYVAMGHIHGPQSVQRPEIRYSGSPLKYSFSEANHRKSVTIVDLLEKGNVQIRTVPLQARRDLRVVRGGMDELMAEPYSEDYVHAIVTDELVAPDARISLTTVFPNLMKFSVENSKTKVDMEIVATETMEKKSPMELFEDFYRLQNNGEAPGEEHLARMKEVFRRLEDSVEP